jgi:hypothetical protein
MNINNILRENKTVASFDVGIKHLAYCIFNTTNPIIIIDWGIVDLTKPQDTPIQLCGCRKSTKIQQLCNKKGCFIKNGVVYCSVHAKKHEDFVFNDKRFSLPSLKKLKIPELIAVCNTYNINVCIESESEPEINVIDIAKKNAKRPLLLERIISFVKSRSFEVICHDNTHSADMNMINVGRNMKKRLNEIPSLLMVDTVLIENQISPIAKRMKDVQVLLTQYFIMKNDDIAIIYISSSNKLKLFSHFVPENSVEINTDSLKISKEIKPDEKTKNQLYAKHKKDAILHTKNIVSKNESLLKWAECLESAKKKDDYADCFLQGLWYLHTMNMIKINNYLIK